MKKNCWEFKKCGREPMGAKVHELGICPAATSQKLNGIHMGKNGGRACWIVAGTFCKGEVQGSFAKKLSQCISCDFYNAVKAEEKDSFKTSSSLLQLTGK